MEKIFGKKKPLTPAMVVFLGNIGANVAARPDQVALQNAKNAIAPKTIFNGLPAVLRRTKEKGGVEHGRVVKKLGKFGKVLDSMVGAMNAQGDDAERQKALAQRAKEWLDADTAKTDGKHDTPVRTRKRQICEMVRRQADLAQRTANAESIVDNTSVARLAPDKLQETLEEQQRRAERIAAEARELQAGITLAFGDTKKPGSGNSRSFLIKDGTGAVRFMFKPIEGEPDMTGTDWPQGCGAPREVMFSALSDMLKNTLQLDLGVTRTTAATLSSDTFVDPEGPNRRITNPRCVGAVQDAIVFDEDGALQCDAQGEADPEKAAKFKPPTKKEISDWKASVSVDDVQKVALLDFLTLNLDRNSKNVLVKHEKGPKGALVRRLIPIDAGNALPPRSLCATQLRSISAGPAIDPEDPIVEGGNLTTQLPQSNVPLNREMAARIKRLDPEEIGKTFNRTEATLPNEMKDKVKRESIEMAKASAAFLKAAVTADESLSVGQIAYLYANYFNEYLDLALPGGNPTATFQDSDGCRQFVGNLVPVVQKAYADVVEDEQARRKYLALKDAGPQGLGVLGYTEDDFKRGKKLDYRGMLQVLEGRTEKPGARNDLAQLETQVHLDAEALNRECRGYAALPLGRKLAALRIIMSNQAALQQSLDELHLTDEQAGRTIGAEYKGSFDLKRGAIDRYKQLQEALRRASFTDDAAAGATVGDEYKGKSLQDKIWALDAYHALQAALRKANFTDDAAAGRALGAEYEGKSLARKKVALEKYLKEHQT